MRISPTSPCREMPVTSSFCCQDTAIWRHCTMRISSIQGEKHSKAPTAARKKEGLTENIDSRPKLLLLPETLEEWRHSPWESALFHAVDALHKLLLLPEHWKNKTFTMRISTIPCSGCPSQAPSAARTLEEEDTHHENKHYSMQWMPFTSSFCCQDTGRRRHSPWE